MLTVTEGGGRAQHTRGTEGRPGKALAGAETPSHTAGTAAVSRKGKQRT